MSFGPLQNKLSILSPSLGEVNGLISSWEKDTVKFGEKGSNLGLGAESEDGYDLGSSHFDVLNVRCRDVGFEVINIVFVTGLCVDTDDGGLFGVVLGEDCTEEQKKK